MIELLLNKGINMFLFIETFSIDIILSLLSIILLNPELDKDLIELENSKPGNIKNYIQEKIHLKRLEDISEKELKYLMTIAKKDNFDKKDNKQIQDLKESVCYFYKKEKRREQFLKISFLKKSGLALMILLVVAIKGYQKYRLEPISTDVYNLYQKTVIILFSFLLYITTLFTIYCFYKSIRLKRRS